jgi:hypothetical protein
MNPTHELEQGARELAEILGPAGFEFVLTGSGQGSGGLFASGEFRMGRRRLELHFRYSLGLVRYHVDGLDLAHDELLRAVRTTNRIHEEGEYPGFSSDPLDAFRRLRRDLERFGKVFTSGSDEQFRVLKRWVDEHPRASGLAALDL